MTDRLAVLKTYKLYINGQFPRSESGRSLPAADAARGMAAHLCLASRKDVRDAVSAARAAQPGWAGRSAYNRGQILYRMAEMLEARRGEMVEALGATPPGKPAGKGRGVKGASPDAEVSACVDRLVAYAGWADKFSQVLGCHNSVNGPFYNFTVAEATGVAAVLAPDTPALLGLVSLLAPVVCAGNTCVCLAGEANPIPAAVFGEVCATSDVPAGVINILTGQRSELVKPIAEHREIDAIHAADLPAQTAVALREGAANNVKRVRVRDVGPGGWSEPECEGPWWIEPFVEMKTIWHPSGA
ncbi:MAG: aldehyde dehydrogenase family protein [Phycisphaerales bacterium]|nr:aldehyde dehydrogenase family protein [Phycisphaerales bacterium]